jgi:hypothetical protein
VELALKIGISTELANISRCTMAVFGLFSRKEAKNKEE